VPQQISKIKKGLSSALALLLAMETPILAASRDFDQCLDFFADRVPPIIQSVDGLNARALCFAGFAVMHSGKSHVPIYVAERLNKQLLSDAQGNERTNQFFEEGRLPSSDRAQLSDIKDLVTTAATWRQLLIWQRMTPWRSALR
jgi:endonuclease G